MSIETVGKERDFFVLEVHAKYTQRVVKIPQTVNLLESFESFRSEKPLSLKPGFSTSLQSNF